MVGALLVVTGLAREARLAAGAGVATLCSGGDVALLAARLKGVDPAGLRGVVSFGLAGGLDPSMAPGDLALATGVTTGAARFETSAAMSFFLLRKAAAAGRSCVEGDFVGVDVPVMTPHAKADLRAKTEAIAVDMESHVAAAWAAAHGLPFAVLRAISDPAGRALPPLAAQALTPDGEVAVGRVLAGLARAPGQIGALVAAGRDSRAAFAALTTVGPALAKVRV